MVMHTGDLLNSKTEWFSPSIVGTNIEKGGSKWLTSQPKDTGNPEASPQAATSPASLQPTRRIGIVIL